MYSYKYPRAALTVDAIVRVKNEGSTHILLVERGKDPFKNKWALPGGFLEIGETLEQACIRELQEETGLNVQHMEQFRAYDAINRDPRHRTKWIKLLEATMPHVPNGFRPTNCRNWLSTMLKY